MSGNCELGRGLRRREKNATEGGAGRFEKPAPDAPAAPLEAHESLIGRKTVEEVPLAGLSLGVRECSVCDNPKQGGVAQPCHRQVQSKVFGRHRQASSAEKPIDHAYDPL